MNENSARTFVGLFLVFSHIGVIALILCAPLYGLFISSSLEFIAIIAPVFAGLTANIVGHFIATKNQELWENSDRYSVPFVVIAIAFPFALVFSIAFVFLAHSLDIFPITMGQAKATIAALEACFAVYVSLVVESMFPRSPAKMA